MCQCPPTLLFVTQPLTTSLTHFATSQTSSQLLNLVRSFSTWFVTSQSGSQLLNQARNFSTWFATFQPGSQQSRLVRRAVLSGGRTCRRLWRCLTAVKNFVEQCLLLTASAHYCYSLNGFLGSDPQITKQKKPMNMKSLKTNFSLVCRPTNCARTDASTFSDFTCFAG